MTEAVACDVNDVVITGELEHRPKRAPDHEGENRALIGLAQALAGEPHTVLQRLAESAMALTRSDSAGISLLEPGGENGMFRWVATAGDWAPYRDGTMPLDASPCGEVIAREAVLLLRRPERAFPALLQAEPGIGEGLLAPFDIDGAPGGTLWVVKHHPDGRFDAEDARLLQSLASFAAAGHRMVAALDGARADHARSEERYRAFVTATADVVYRMSPDWTQMRQLDGRGFMADAAETIPDWMDRYILPEDRARVQAEIDRAIRTRSMFELEHRVRSADGSVGWTLSRAVPVLDDAGEIVEWLGAATDITERKRGEAALLESEGRFRGFAENSADVLWIVDTGTMQLEYLSPAFERVWGESREAVMRDLGRWADLVHPDDRAQAAGGMPRLLAGRPYVGTYRIVRPDGAVRWIRDTGFPIVEDGVTRVGGIAQDMTERHRAEERQRLLLAELQHRVRNIIATIRSIARRTAETSDTVEDYAQHLEGRINAMARTQLVLTRHPGAGVSLPEIVAEELLSVAAREDRYRCHGPELTVDPKAAEVLTLAVHELATNAVKYGALSHREGRLAISWWRETRGSERWAVVEWKETMADAAGGTERQGFGTELITRRVPYELGGTGTLDVAPGTVRARIEFPIRPGSSILESGAAGLEMVS